MLNVACKYVTQSKRINKIETEQKQRLTTRGSDQVRNLLQ